MKRLKTLAKKSPQASNTAQDLLFEIGTEELPAAYLPDLIKQLTDQTAARLQAAHLSYQSLKSFGTPRRLVLVIGRLSAIQAIPAEEVRGPAKQAAYDAQGKPTQALLGFVRSRGTSLDQVKLVSVDKKGEYVYLMKNASSRPTRQILPQFLAELVGALRSPKTMRWDASGVRFARPIRWLLAKFGQESVPVVYGRLKSAPQTWVGLPLKPRRISIKSLPEYLKVLKTAGIVLSHEDRRAMILRMVADCAKRSGGASAPETVSYGLVDEVAFLTERPESFVGSFDQQYLSLPREVLLASMSKHQRVFAMQSADGKLLPKFVAVLDGHPSEAAEVKRIFERILNARLTDSLFFWKQDHSRHVPLGKGDLSGVSMHEKLGSMREKAARLEQLAEKLSQLWQLTDTDRESLVQASKRAKHDLLTNLVREFPTLQGVMGKYYALSSNLSPQVAEAIEEHYLPLAGKHPKSLTGSALALIDKYDTLAAYFSIGIEPTGDQDPFGLRRAAQGIVEIAWQSGRALSLAALFESWSEAMERTLGAKPDGKLAARLRGYLLERLYTFEWTSRQGKQAGSITPTREIIDAVLASDCDDLVDAMDRMVSLQRLSGQDKLAQAAKIIERTRNILRSAKPAQKDVDPTRLLEPLELKLWDVYNSQKSRIRELVDKRSYEAATDAFSEAFAAPLHDFFANVMVNAPDESLKQNRLALMQAIQALYTDRVADLSKLTGLQP